MSMKIPLNRYLIVVGADVVAAFVVAAVVVAADVVAAVVVAADVVEADVVAADVVEAFVVAAVVDVNEDSIEQILNSCCSFCCCS